MAVRSAYDAANSGDPRHVNNCLITPPHILDAARRSFGREIVFDPCSSELANRVVRAGWYGSLDGTTADQFPTWNSPATWLNPPYGRGLCKPHVARLVAELNAATFPAIALTNFDHSTDWCQILLMCERLTPVLLWDRLVFHNPLTLEPMKDAKGRPATGGKPQVVWISDKCDPAPWFELGSIWERIPAPSEVSP